MTVARFLNHSLEAILKSHGPWRGQSNLPEGCSAWRLSLPSWRWWRRAGAGSRCILILIRVHFERLVGIREGGVGGVWTGPSYTNADIEVKSRGTSVALRTPPWLDSEWGCRNRRLSRGQKTPDRQPGPCSCLLTKHKLCRAPGAPAHRWVRFAQVPND
jgi:hypothetical protein